jgi:hypothetical protein
MSTEEQAIRAAGCLPAGLSFCTFPPETLVMRPWSDGSTLYVSPRPRSWCSPSVVDEEPKAAGWRGRGSGGVTSHGRGEAAGQGCPEENDGMAESSRSCKTDFSPMIAPARKVFVRTPPRYLLSAQLMQIRFICAVKVK